jgi:hypothetical protein
VGTVSCSEDDFTIPVPLRRELANLVDQVKAGPILSLAKLLPELGRGLRLTAANVKYIRQRFAARLMEQGKLTDEMRLFFAHEGLNGNLVMVFSVTVLAECLPEFLSLYGRDSFLVALLVDARPEVRQIATEYCRDEEWQSRPLLTKEEARDALLLNKILP